MADTDEEEASPLLNPKADNGVAGLLAGCNPNFQLPPVSPVADPLVADPVGCGGNGSVHLSAEGVPISHGSVVGEPLPREQWDSGLFSCLGRNDEFCSSDL